MRRVVGAAMVAAGCLAAGPALAQAAPPGDAITRWRILNELRAAMAPALPYPESDAAGVAPADGASPARWMVRPLDRDLPFIEVIANPLNADHQALAARAMAEIEAAIERANARSQAQYEGAVAEAQRTGRSQDVDGVTLADEGVAGARIDAESHVVIEVAFNQASYEWTVAGAIPPEAGEVVIPGASGVVTVAAHEYRGRSRDDVEAQFSQAEVYVFYGVPPPAVHPREARQYEVSAVTTATADTSSAVRSLAVRLRGNQQLMAEILSRSDWSRVRALLDP